jgi:hypothetical protein
MAFEQVHAAMEEGLSNTAPSTATETDTDTQAATGNEANTLAGTTGEQNLTAKQAQDVIELEKLAKFKWEGKEWSLDDLKKSVMRHADYSKKTQKFNEEKKSYEDKLRGFEESQKYESNLDADLENVRQNPSLAARFKEIYPEKYHRFLDHTLSTLGQGQTTQPTTQVDPAIMKSIQDMQRKIDNAVNFVESSKAEKFEAEVGAKQTLLDSACEKYSAKYDLADQETVLTKAQYLINKGHFGDPKAPDYTEKFMKGLEDLYKQSHDVHDKRYAARYQSKVEKQKQANGQAKDIAPGGGTPARAPAKMRLKDVKGALEEHMMSLP